ncbi:MAG: helix-turn-helix domain-containing protein [Chitinivibrionales bacterium]|nr:helix-turn-helix domain-containing protein [Chitinivibrionales bacterium]
MGELLKVRDVARIVGVDATTVLRWIEKGYLRSIRYPSGTHRIPEEELQRLLRKAGEFGKVFSCMVVDGNAVSLDETAGLLKSMSVPLDVRAYGSALDGLLDMVAHRPDLIIMDAASDTVDGVSMCARIRSREDLASIPLILTAMETGHEIPANLEEEHVLRKPYSASRLEQAVRDALGLKPRRRTRKSGAAALNPG